MFINVSEKKFAFCTSFFITILIFSVFFLQIIKFGEGTFNAGGDSLALTTASIFKLSSVIFNGQLWGMDLDSFNGSTEFMLRANIPTHYPPMILLAIIYGIVSSFKVKQVLLVLFYAVHLFAGLYCSQRMTQKFFCVNRYLSLLYAVSLLGVYFSAIWYVSFFIVSTLMIPALYCLLELYNSSNNLGKLKFIWFSSLAYVFMFTSGYIAISCAATVVIFVYVLMYVGRKGTILDKKNAVWSKVALPYISSLFIVLFYYVSVKGFVGGSATSGGFPINVTIDLSLPMTGFLYLLSHYLNIPLKSGEELYLLSIGILWGGAIVLFVQNGISNRVHDEFKRIFWLGFLINAICLILCFGASTPFAAWFYYLVPIFGSMHLPIRFLLFLAPLFYLSSVIGLKYLSDEDVSKKKLKILWGIIAVMALMLLILPNDISSAFFTHRDKVMIELLGTLVALAFLIKNGITNCKTIVVISAILFCLHTNYLYLIERAYDDPKINNHTIVHNVDQRNLIASYLDDNFNHRKRLHFSVYEKNAGSKQFVPDNYSWYGELSYFMTGYSGYEPHLCAPKQYMEMMPYLQVFDSNYINYLNDTRCDLLIVKDEDVSTDEERRLLVEYTEKPLKLSPEYTLYSFRKHGNSVYLGLHVKEGNQSLDNGYFYSPDLNSNSVINFDTDNSSTFTLEYQSEHDAHITFLFYPNRFLHYYIDNQEIKPEITRGQAYWTIPEGNHVLSVKYESKIVKIGELIIFGYYLLILIMLLAHCIRIAFLKRHRI